MATLSRTLKEADAKSVANLRALLRELLFKRLVKLALPRITLDFDGPVLSTTRRAQGTAVGFNKKKKGARSYYGYDFKVVVTHKTPSPKKVRAFHQGRGTQEGIFGELNTHGQMGYVPVRKRLGNQMYLQKPYGEKCQ